MISPEAAPVLPTRRALPKGTWVLAAHPDDEIIGLGATLAASAANGCGVLHVTGGAPADRSLWPAECASGTQQDYAAMRRCEAETALAYAGVPIERIHCLGAEDQKVIRRVSELARVLADWLMPQRLAVLITHPYEGGHPDHDATALVAHLARALLWRRGVQAPRLYEMTSYHGRDGELRTGEFLYEGGLSFERVLDAHDRELKRRMLDAFWSQRRTLAPFGVDVERFRPAPPYRFDHPPHPGPLCYERMGWMDGREWRALAMRALDDFSLQEDACL